MLIETAVWEYQGGGGSSQISEIEKCNILTQALFEDEVILIMLK